MPITKRKSLSRLNLHGFTLIELLVVIAMIAILLSILFPAYFAVVQSMHRVSCVNHMQALSQDIEMYRQQGSTGYPELPNYVDAFGIPLGGVTGALATNHKTDSAILWCRDDRFPRDLPITANQQAVGLTRDRTNSTYNYGYNYYGYVTTTDGMPFPITTLEAAYYFFKNPFDVDQSLHDFLTSGSNAYSEQQIAETFDWDLGLIDGTNPKTCRPKGLFKGLTNSWCPPDTIETFCTNHMGRVFKNIPGGGKLNTIAMMTVSGNLVAIRPQRPIADDGNTLLEGGSAFRFPNTAAPNRNVAIDWRLNKASYGEKVKLAADFGDSLRTDIITKMPVVKTYYRCFTADDVKAANANGNWYDTAIELYPHDYVMVLANARWGWFMPSSINAGLFTSPPYNNFKSDYENLQNEAHQILFTADGDPVEAHNVKSLLSQGNDFLFPGAPHACLLGRAGLNGAIVPLRSHGSFIAEQGPLFLSMNNTPAAASGWCEVWIAVFRPGNAR